MAPYPGPLGGQITPNDIRQFSWYEEDDTGMVAFTSYRKSEGRSLPLLIQNNTFTCLGINHRQILTYLQQAPPHNIPIHSFSITSCKIRI